MMLWSDNITRAPGEICLVKCSVLSASNPLSFDWKKNLLTFSATTNACLKKKKKKKRKKKPVKRGWLYIIRVLFVHCCQPVQSQ